jgi:signal peptide peptidase SppA
MRFLNIIYAVYSQPWLILPSYHANIRRVVRDRLLTTGAEWKAQDREGVDFSGEAVALPSMRIVDGVAEIPVPGVLLKGATAFEKGMGAVAVEDVMRDIAEALTSDEVGGIFLDVDSPGGTVGGIPELGEAVAAAARIKPVRAFTDGMMCSAAYWMAAGATDILASRSADVGSIGVYVPWIDESEAFSMQGVTVEIIRNEGADLKGMGFPGVPLTEAQREELQNSVNETADEFHGHVTAYRQVSKPLDTFRGQSFSAKNAKDRGLVDEIMDRESALADFRDCLTS